MTRKEIEKLSPVKIRYEPCHNVGVFRWPKEPAGNRKPHIIIDNNLELAKEMIVTLHEIGHAIHFINGCPCMQDNNQTLAEYHAHRFIMKHIKDNVKLVTEFKKLMVEFSNCLVNQTKTTAKRIMKLKSYAKLV